MVWPLTIVRTRYGGVYEGGKFAAFNSEPDGIRWHLPCMATEDSEPDAFGGDPDCMSWWMLAPLVMPVGVGETIEEAVQSLELAIQREEKRDEPKAIEH